jgi:citrate synthase
MLVHNTKYATKKMLSYFTTLLNIFSSFLVYLSSLFSGIPIFTFQSLWLCDLRTFRWYSIPIMHGAVDAMQFRRISPLSLTASIEEQMAEGLLVGPSSFQI